MEKSRNKDPKVTIKIPRPLYNNLKEIIAGSGFDSATDFIVYVLRDIISHELYQGKESLSAGEIDIIRKRLKALGYFS